MTSDFALEVAKYSQTSPKYPQIAITREGFLWVCLHVGPMLRCLPLCAVVRDDSARTWQTDRSVLLLVMSNRFGCSSTESARYHRRTARTTCLPRKIGSGVRPSGPISSLDVTFLVFEDG